MGHFTRDDVRKEMGWIEGDQYRDICEEHHHSMSESVDRFNVEDGASMSRIGDESRRALDNLERAERRQEEQRQEEAEQERQEEERQRRRQEEEYQLSQMEEQ